MSVLKPLTDYNFIMKVVADLGMKKPTENYYKKVRMAIFECTNCSLHFEAVVSKKAQKQQFCRNCQNTGLKKQNRDHPLYRIWADTRAKIKCSDKRAISYLDKGISMYPQWDSDFDAFFAWATSSGWQKGLTLDRINNDGDYTPDNCRWVSYSVQIANQRLLKSTNTSGYRGIFKSSNDRWIANIKYEKKNYGLGSFKDPITAAKAYDTFIKLMDWPHTHNNILDENEYVFPTNKTTVKFLSSIGIHEGDFMSKEP